MAPRTALQNDDPPRSHERGMLAHAAENHRTLGKRYKAYGDALAQVFTDIARCSRDIGVAERAVTEAQADASKHRVAEALGDADTHLPSPSVADARRTLESARDRLAELKAAQLTLHREEADCASHLEIAALNLKDCVAIVVRNDPAALALIQCLELTRSRFTTLSMAVDYLAANNMAPAQTPHAVSAVMDVEQEWRLAVAALAADPDVLLPFPLD